MLFLKRLKDFALTKKLLISFILELSTLFLVLTYMVNNGTIIKKINSSIYSSFLENRSDTIVEIFKIITHLGESKVIAIFSLILLAVLWRKNKKPEFASLFTLLGSAGVLIYFFKHLIQEPRPEFGVIVETSYSFPSGHSTISVAFYGLIIWYFFIKDGFKKKNILPVLAGTSLILSIALSRMILGVHYYFDVVGGLVLGTICLLTSILVFRFFEKTLNKN